MKQSNDNGIHIFPVSYIDIYRGAIEAADGVVKIYTLESNSPGWNCTIEDRAMPSSPAL